MPTRSSQSNHASSSSTLQNATQEASKTANAQLPYSTPHSDPLAHNKNLLSSIPSTPPAAIHPSYPYGINPVLYYIPNLIGYIRVLLTFFSFVTCWSYPITTMLLYAISQLMDALDGTAARYYHQVSKFGGVLDMLTDRMSTGVLFIVLSHQYPAHWGAFALLLVLDIVSHWFQMYSKLLLGKTTHKGASNPLLNFYYTFPYALLLHCVGNEGYFISLYILGFPSYTISSYLYTCFYCIHYICLPIACIKQLMNLIQLWESTKEIVDLDYKNAMQK